MNHVDWQTILFRACTYLTVGVSAFRVSINMPPAALHLLCHRHADSRYWDSRLPYIG